MRKMAAIITLIAVGFMLVAGCTETKSGSGNLGPVVSVEVSQIGDKVYVEAKNLASSSYSFYVGIKEKDSNGVVIGDHVVRISAIQPGETGKDYTYVESRNSNVQIANVGVMVGGDLKLVHYQQTEKNCTEIGSSEDGRTHTMSCETKVIRSV